MLSDCCICSRLCARKAERSSLLVRMTKQSSSLSCIRAGMQCRAFHSLISSLVRLSAACCDVLLDDTASSSGSGAVPLDSPVWSLPLNETGVCCCSLCLSLPPHIPEKLGCCVVEQTRTSVSQASLCRMSLSACELGVSGMKGRAFGQAFSMFSPK